MVRNRWLVVAAWLIVLLAGGYANGKLSSLLSNTFTMPGTDSERARAILEKHYGDRSDGAFTVVFHVPNAGDTPMKLYLQRAMARAAKQVPSGEARPLARAGNHVFYGDIVTTLNIADAKGYTDDILRALPHRFFVTPYVTGQAAIQHDLDPIFNEDLKKGELEIAVPIALVVLLLVFGLSAAVTIPLLFMPSPFMRSMGIGGFLIPLVSMLAAVTLQPALLSLYGRKGTRRAPVAEFLRRRVHVPLPRLAGTSDIDRGMWARLARAIMRRPSAFLAGGAALLIAAAIPVFALELTPGSASGIPQHPQAVRGFNILKEAVGAGALSP